VSLLCTHLLQLLTSEIGTLRTCAFRQLVVQRSNPAKRLRVRGRGPGAVQGEISPVVAAALRYATCVGFVVRIAGVPGSEMLAAVGVREGQWSAHPHSADVPAPRDYRRASHCHMAAARWRHASLSAGVLAAGARRTGSLGAIYARYRRWCDETTATALAAAAFAQEFKGICGRVALRTRKNGSKVYVRDVGLSA
jgi:hypothetical protein